MVMQKVEHAVRALAESMGSQPDAHPFKDVDAFFSALANADDRVANLSPGLVYEAQYSFFGAINRAFQSTVSAVANLYMRNLNGFWCSQRSLIETVGFLSHCHRSPQRLIAAYSSNQTSTGKLLNAGYQKYPQLRAMYHHASTVAHPARSSFWLGFRRRQGSPGGVTGIDLHFSTPVARDCLENLTSVGSFMIAELDEFIEAKADAILAGKIVARFDGGQANVTPNFSCQYWEPRSERRNQARCSGAE